MANILDSTQVCAVFHNVHAYRRGYLAARGAGRFLSSLTFRGASLVGLGPCDFTFQWYWQCLPNFALTARGKLPATVALRLMGLHKQQRQRAQQQLAALPIPVRRLGRQSLYCDVERLPGQLPRFFAQTI